MRTPDLLSPRILVFSWLVAAAAAPAAILTAVVGQGLGAMVGGCTWIGLSTPLHRQAWALVNQPTLAFAASSEAAGYWLGSVVVPLAAILVVPVAVRRPHRLALDLAATQWTWALAVVALAWQPLLEGEDGQVARCLHFVGAKPWLLWAVPVTAVAAGLLPALRLLATLRLARRNPGRAAREVALILHLAMPAAAFVAVATLLRGEPMRAGLVAVVAVVVAPLILSWSRYPSIPPARPSDLAPVNWLVAAGMALVLAAVVWCGGRPVAPDMVAGITWAAATDNDNVRPWIDPLPAGDAILACIPARR